MGTGKPLTNFEQGTDPTSAPRECVILHISLHLCPFPSLRKKWSFCYHTPPIEYVGKIAGGKRGHREKTSESAFTAASGEGVVGVLKDMRTGVARRICPEGRMVGCLPPGLLSSSETQAQSLGALPLEGCSSFEHLYRSMLFRVPQPTHKEDIRGL